MKLIWINLFMLLMTPFWSFSQEITKEKQQLSNGWYFLKEDIGGIWETVRVAQKGQPTDYPLWEKVSLPHCFNTFDAVDPDLNYYQGPGWYKTSLQINNPYKNGRTLLHFEGAGQKTEVWVGLEMAGSHVGGYDEFTIDITSFIPKALANSSIVENFKGNVPLAIRCDNSRDLEMIPSDLSDFHVYGGLYRNVWVEYVPQNWFEGMKIDAVLSEKMKDGSIALQLKPGIAFTQAPEINITITDPKGNIIISKKEVSETFSYSFPISKVSLWSPSNPQLYGITIEANFNGQVQTLTDRFGFRQFEFVKKGPFMLNGSRLLLKGTHRHDDFAGVGAAQTEKMIRDEMQLIKDMGANFIRLGHYQQSKQVLNLCDSLGILVWEEIPWCRGGLGGDVYREQAKRMLSNMITQHYNHPAVILWGLGNENDWPGDFEQFEQDSIRAFMSILNDLSHRLDPARLTTIRRCEFCSTIVDVYSPSIWAGWYRGVYTDYKQVSENEMKKVDRFFHAEWGADSHAGRHSEAIEQQWKNIESSNSADERAGDASLYGGANRISRDGDWSESYAVELYDWTLKEQLDMPWLTGSAFWTFKDFATPIRPENPIPYVNQKGVVQRDLTLKETFYVVQSYWSEKPMVHIYGHSWPVRWGKADEKSTLKVYSNCEKVELFVNGKSHGVKVRNTKLFPACGLVWNVQLSSGENKVEAVAYAGKEKLTDALTWKFQTGEWGKTASLKLSEEKIDENSSYLNVLALDANGLICLDSKLLVEFQIAGEATLNQNQGTTTGSRKIQLANGQAKIKINKTGNKFAASVKAETGECDIIYSE